MEETSNIPVHIAIIPDGNRRWGKAHGIIPHEGIKEGAERFREVASKAFEKGVSCVTFWAASEDNFTKRVPEEVRFMIILLKKIGKERSFLEELKKNNISLRWIGLWREILNDPEINSLIDSMESETASTSGYKLTMLYGYDGRREMRVAIKKLQEEGCLNPSYEDIKRSLWTGSLPDVDLVIRTGGEPHWSAGFMMWLTANSQLYFSDLLWPDFTKEKLDEALEEYAKRKRRFGK